MCPDSAKVQRLSILGAIRGRPRFCLQLLLASAMFAGACCVGGPVWGQEEERRFSTSESQLIQDVIRAYGGEDGVRRVKTVYSKGYITAFMMGQSGVSTRYFKHPRKLRAELVYPHSSETRVLNGFYGWRGTDSAPMVEVKGPPYLAMAYQYKYLDFPRGFIDGGYKIKYKGREPLGSGEADVLLVSDAEGPPMRIYLDPRKHLILKVSGAFTFAGGVSTELSAEFYDYRKVGGVMFPFRIINYGGESRISETVLTEIEVNQEMNEALFSPIADERRLR